MNKNNRNEILSSDKLEVINSKLKEKEELSLPESLCVEKIEELLLNPEIKREKTEKPRELKRRWASAIAIAASIAIIVTSVFIAGTWEKAKAPHKLLPSEVVVAEDYTQIEGLFRAYAQSYKLADIYNDIFYNGWFGATKEEGFVDGEVGAPSVTVPSVNAGAGNNYLADDAVDVGFGETNEQVSGVSEADIIKNDGEYIYTAGLTKFGNGMFLSDTTSPYVDDYEGVEGASSETKNACCIDIIKPDINGKLTRVSTLSITTDQENVLGMSLLEMYVSGNRLIAFVECRTAKEGYEADYWYGYDSSVMTVCFDIANKASVKELWCVYQDGNYVSSRLIGDQLVILSEYYVSLDREEEEIVGSCVPKTAVNDSELKRIPCDCVHIMSEINNTSYLVASTMRVTDSNTFNTKAVLGGGSEVYCNTESLYVTSTKYKSIDLARDVFGVTESKTLILKFDITDNKIEYSGTCSVKGTTLNQFSIDEYNGNLRIATTTGSWGDSLENQVYVIDGKSLEIIGELTGLAPGESIKSVRFTGDTGYVVTFMQTDPLFVIDFSEPTAPELKGELKVTGFSSYLHPVGENLLVGIGPDGTESGTNNGMKISLFDVSDPTSPKEVDKLVVNGYVSNERFVYVSSPCYDTHKAFCWSASENKMYIPYGKQDSDYIYGGYSVTLGILGVSVDVSSKTLVSDGDYVKTVDNYNYSDSFTRVTYIGDVIIGYSYQGGALVAFDKATQQITDTIDIGIG